MSISNTVDPQAGAGDIQVGDVVAVSTKRKAFGIKAVPLHGKAPVNVPTDAEFRVTGTREDGTLDLQAHWSVNGTMFVGKATGYNAVLFKKITPTLPIEDSVTMPETSAEKNRRMIAERLAGTRAHSALGRVVTLAQRRDLDGHRLPIYLVGPAGSGKTYLGRQLSKIVDLPFRSIVFSPGLPESALIGRMVPSLTTGEQVYHDTPFVKSFRDGGVFLGDEGDNADPSTMIILNQALANGEITLPDGSEVKRHKDFVFVMGANTYGRGADRIYVGRAQLDAATLDRFALSKVYIDYDRALERELVGDDKELLKWWWTVRDAAREKNLQKVVSTRGLIQAMAARLDGESIEEILDDFTQDWTKDERTKVGIVWVAGERNKAGPGTRPKPISSFDQEMSNPRGF